MRGSNLHLAMPMSSICLKAEDKTHHYGLPPALLLAHQNASPGTLSEPHSAEALTLQPRPSGYAGKSGAAPAVFSDSPSDSCFTGAVYWRMLVPPPGKRGRRSTLC